MGGETPVWDSPGGGIPIGRDGGGTLVLMTGGKPIGGCGKRANRACGIFGEVFTTGGGRYGGGVPIVVGGENLTVVSDDPADL